MSMVTLQVLERAHREVMKLPQGEKGAFYTFLHKFRHNPDSPGPRRKQLKGDSRLWSARVTDDYRALLLHIGEQDYLVLSVKHRKDVYENLDRYEYRINRVTGGIEVVDLTAVGDSLVGRLIPETDAPPQPPAGLFAAYSPQQLLDLGVVEPLLGSIARITTEDELLALAEIAPQLTAEVLLALYEGRTVDEVMEQVTTPVKADETVDITDFTAALARPATPVTSDDAAMQAVIDQPFEQWQLFLHPTQGKLVAKDYRGPVKVSGGPGTGKTVVALHRVKHLASTLEPGTDRPVLLTTFNRNLAADLRTRLLALAGPELADRVDIVNIYRLASRVVAEAGAGEGRRIIDNEKALELWARLLMERKKPPFDAEFLADEWAQVILGQVVDSRAAYFQARRTGRGRALTREERNNVWNEVERFTQRLDESGLWTWRQVAAAAARVEQDRTASDTYRYRHIVVDEAQDLGPAHWKMLRAMVADGPNDIFLVGDTHQRIYNNYVTLSSLGINVRGRSSRLTLSYRTTRQILATALGMLTGQTYDDLDGGTDTLGGYRSLLRGPQPSVHGVSSWHDEQDLIVSQLKAWGPNSSLAVCVPIRQMVTDVLSRLSTVGIPAAEIGPDGPRSPDGVHVGTMHRFKGLEYQRMIIAGVREGLVPHSDIEQHRGDPRRYERDRMRDRSRLFVAATRARDELAIIWHGAPSPFLPTVS
jgi:superfamily I DNA/RNA helicase/mRNA-degrading endonuclease RelE of RelBE toxin-antitoxin system